MDIETLESGGWIKVHRKLLDSAVAQHDGLLLLWLHCLLRAGWKDKTVLLPGTTRQITLKRGQFITGRNALHACMYPERDKEGRKIRREVPPPSPSTLWRWLKNLEAAGQVSLKSEHTCTIVTVCNYSTYQDDSRDSGPRVNRACPTDEPRLPHACPERDPCVNTTKKDNNSKKERREEREEGPSPTEGDFSHEWKTQLPPGEDGRAIRAFVAQWNSTEGTQPIERPADLGELSRLVFLLNDPAWKLNHLKALQKFPLPYFEADGGMHVLWFLEHGAVEKILAGKYNFVPKDRQPQSRTPSDMSHLQNLEAFAHEQC